MFWPPNIVWLRRTRQPIRAQRSLTIKLFCRPMKSINGAKQELQKRSKKMKKIGPFKRNMFFVPAENGQNMSKPWFSRFPWQSTSPPLGATRLAECFWRGFGSSGSSLGCRSASWLWWCFFEGIDIWSAPSWPWWRKEDKLGCYTVWKTALKKNYILGMIIIHELKNPFLTNQNKVMTEGMTEGLEHCSFGNIDTKWYENI